MGIDKNPLGEQIKGTGTPALPRNFKPRYCGNSGTQVTGGSSSVLDSFKDYLLEGWKEKHGID